MVNFLDLFEILLKKNYPKFESSPLKFFDPYLLSAAPCPQPPSSFIVIAELFSAGTGAACGSSVANIGSCVACGSSVVVLGSHLAVVGRQNARVQHKILSGRSKVRNLTRFIQERYQHSHHLIPSGLRPSPTPPPPLPADNRAPSLMAWNWNVDASAHFPLLSSSS
ncbi:hypothetical protein Ahy_A01g004015 isoform D [Arachis hypogaea]|uniref:Uncharacterized protein n=1 Tax=Arachis hypogaea TaxID=3818 RepID=A0A445EUJ7_ARAHY|nr:hypothetical protein Ahy_A01g004015 isoform D [Arachis hypogaea]